MCFYIHYQFECDDFQLGPLDHHCDQIECQQPGKLCPGKDDILDCCPEETTCEWMEMVMPVRRRKGQCRTCRKLVLKDERRLQKEIRLRYQAITMVETSLKRHQRRMILRPRDPINIGADWIERQENRIQRYDEAILFLADGSKEKDRYVSEFLKHIEQRQVDREVGILEAQRDVLAGKRWQCWDDLATLLDL